MQEVISGYLVGLDETVIRLRLRTGEVKVYERKELAISLQWVLQNMSQPVICLIEDGVVRKMKPLGQRSQPGEADVA
jgi:hypothetical protein